MTAEERHADKTRRVALDGTEYDCQAYGPASRGYCFFEQVDECQTRLECVQRMSIERMLMWVSLTARANAGDPDCIAILAGFTAPEQLLNGDYWHDAAQELAHLLEPGAAEDD